MTQQLEDLVAKAVECDRLFFQRRPRRRHRIRHAHSAEIKKEGLRQPPSGFRWFAVVRYIRVGTGARIRLFTLNRENAEVDLHEAICCDEYEHLATPNDWEMEARIRARLSGDAT